MIQNSVKKDVLFSYNREKIKTTGEELADPNVKLAIEMKREEDDMVKYV